MRYICQVVIALIVSAIAGCSSAPEKTEKKEEPPLETIILDDNYVQKDAKKEAYRHYKSGEAYSELGAAALALEEYWKAFELDKNALYLNRLGIASLRLKRFGDARYFFEEADKMAPNTPENIANLAFIDLIQQRYSKAEEGYRKVIKNAPDSIMISYNLAYSILAVTFANQKITDEEALKSQLDDAQKERLREARRLFENSRSLPMSQNQDMAASERQCRENAGRIVEKIDYLLAR